MKKNITINLCGRLFAIDEDAYEMLATYEQSLRAYFRQRDGGEEIVDDLEARIAELFDELKAQGTEAINIEHVREVIHRIGKPEEMDEQPNPSPIQGKGAKTGGGGQATTGSSSRNEAGGEASKRLYRNPDDKKMMGVLSGFAAYFGGDVLWWRLGYAAIVLLSFVGSSYNFLWFWPGRALYFNIYYWGFALIVAYILLAVLMPIAETPEDRLRMKGKEVNPQNLAEEVAQGKPNHFTSRESTPNNQYRKDTQPIPSAITESGTKADGGQAATGSPYRGGTGANGSGASHGCLSLLGCIGGFFSALFAVVTTLFRWCIYTFGAFVAAMCLMGIVCLAAVALNPVAFLHKFGWFWESSELAAAVPGLTIPFYIFVVAALLFLSITAYAIIHSLLNEFRQMPSMPYRQRIALLVMWIVGLVAAGSALGYGLPQFIDAMDAFTRRVRLDEETEYRERNLHDGIFVQPHEWEFLQEHGWTLLNVEGCNDRFTAYGEYMTGDRDVRYIDTYDEQHRQRLRIERTDSLMPGTYRLTCAARANGTGACVYVIIGDGKPLFMEIPATGNTGGDIWEDAEAERYLLLMKERGRAAERGEADFADENVEIPERVQQLRKANSGKGFGWNYIGTSPIRITKPTVVRYGVSSDPAFTGKTWLGQWFSATDFEVKRVE